MFYTYYTLLYTYLVVPYTRRHPEVAYLEHALLGDEDVLARQRSISNSNYKLQAYLRLNVEVDNPTLMHVS
jgi:hypothetical protein